MNRRTLLAAIAGTGIGSTFFHRALASAAVGVNEITVEMVKDAEWVSGIELSDDERDETVSSLKRMMGGLESLRQIKLTNDVAPAVSFKTLAPAVNNITKPERAPKLTVNPNVKMPDSDESLAFLPVTQLGKLIRNRELTSMRLTKLYLARLKKYDSLLKCVVNLTEELALKQARRADDEIAAGKYRGPLHGIPWGAKDLMAVPDYPTTWGAPQYEKQKLDYTSTVAQRLEAAGAVLVAKLSMGALAMGDQWFGGKTRCPWNYKSGSSGSSAGSASATVAGLVGFSIGTETLGSIISPSRRCGATGLRPTFGRVSRYGCMALSWTMDKVGPICRSVEDCALVFAAIHGADGKDPTAETREFQWPPKVDLSKLKVGFTKGRTPIEERTDIQQLKKLGVQLVEVKLPERIPTRAVTSVLDVEAAAAFDELTRNSNVAGLNAWPRIFRTASFVPAIDYVRAMRARTLLQRDFEQFMGTVDILVNTNDLVHTNLTGHPSIAIPIGLRNRMGTDMPYSTIFTGQLNQETPLLALALAYQDLHDQHLKQPPLEDQMVKMKAELKAETETENKPDADSGKQRKSLGK